MEKHCIGIDVSKDYLDCCYGNIDIHQSQKFSKPKRFVNNSVGFAGLIKWAKENASLQNISFVMEATGVYYEHLAYFLNEEKCSISVLLPNVVKHYSKSLNVKTKTDQKDSALLCKLGLERKLTQWMVPSKIMRHIKLLSREYREVKDKVNQLKNQLHAKEYSFECPESIKKRLKKQLSILETQALEIEAELRTLAMSDTKFYDKVQKLCTIPGVSFITVICILGETNAFALITNIKQLASYVGLDVQHNQSGQKQGKSRISKKGNSFIRQGLYMPALCASRFNPTLQQFYKRLSERKVSKKIAVIAVARKLLILMFVLWKNDTEYDPDFLKVDRVSPVYTG